VVYLSIIIRHKQAAWNGTLRVHHSAHAVFDLVAVTGPFARSAAVASQPSKKQTATLMLAFGGRNLQDCGAAARLGSDTNQPPSQPARPSRLAVLLYPMHALIPSPNPVQREALQAEVWASAADLQSSFCR
jgi:hypothetical protein